MQTNWYAPLRDYGSIQQFIYDHFLLFNGILNPLMPATYLVFEHDPDKHVQGDNLGDIVNINIYNLIRMANDNKMTDSQFKGYVLYVVMHELIHLDQDIQYYRENYPNNAFDMIERSCHAKTFITMNNYLNSYMSIPGNLKYFDCPFMTSFIESKEIEAIEDKGNGEEIMNCAYELAKDFKTITDPRQKALYCVGVGLYGTNYKRIFQDIVKYKNILIKVEFNNNTFYQNFIQYLGCLVNYQAILESFRLALFFTKQTNKRMQDKTGSYAIHDISLYRFEDKKYGADTLIFQLVITGKLDVYYKFNSVPVYSDCQ